VNFLNKIFKRRKNSGLNYGVFNDFWNGHPNHLPLLQLRYSEENTQEWNLINSFKILDDIFLKNNEIDLGTGIKLLLRAENWRAHLVACIAILKISKHQQNLLKTDFWEFLETKFSMVSPQILVILSIIDNDFETRAKNISKNGFIVSYYNPRTKENIKKNSAKIISSIEYLLNGKYSDIIENENGGIHSKKWKDKLIPLIESNKLSTQHL